jgi:hypothetical protein
MLLTFFSFSSLSGPAGEQDDQRRTRSLSQLNMPGGGGGRQGSVLLASGDSGVDTEKEIQAASERRRTTARYDYLDIVPGSVPW